MKERNSTIISQYQKNEHAPRFLTDHITLAMELPSRHWHIQPWGF